MTMTPRVADISHHNTVGSFQEAADAGLWGIIHKATQGSTYQDPDYVKRRQAARDAGLLWGAYHFNDGSDVVTQVANFLRYADPDTGTLLVLDYEDNPRSNMSIAQMIQFLKLVELRGYRCAIYSGNRLKETIGRLSSSDRDYVTSHMLWLCQYGPRAVLPPGYDAYFLWQYTDGVVGPQPRTIAGLKGQVDLNVFQGTRDALEEVWVSGGSSHSREDYDTTSSHSNDAALDAPPVSRGDVRAIQQDLFDMGYFEVGNVDGRWGSRTVAATAAFYHDRSIDARPAADRTLTDAINDAMQDNWRRPVSDTRASATPEDLQHSSDAVRLSLWQRMWAKVAVAAGGLGLGGSTISDTFETVKAKLEPIETMFASVPPSVWFALVILVAGAVWYASTRTAQATTSDYKLGRLN